VIQSVGDYFQANAAHTDEYLFLLPTRQGQPVDSRLVLFALIQFFYQIFASRKCSLAGIDHLVQQGAIPLVFVQLQ
jgi:hypothetical protein